MTITQIVNRIYRLTHTNSTSYVAANMLDDINIAYNRVVSLVIKADGRWQWEDANNTDLPIATTALVASQRDYTLATSHLKIIRVRLKDTGGNWKVLPAIDPEDEDYADLMESTTTGIPSVHDKSGSSVFLGLTPNYSQAASLELTFQRGPAEFTSAEVSTGTKVPGFNSLYHDLIPLWVAYDYWMMNDPTMCIKVMDQITLKETALKNDYAMRGKDDKPRLRILNQNNK